MEKEKASLIGGGISLGLIVMACTAMCLTILFGILKSVGVIAWSWFWIVSPLWMTVGIPALVIVVGLILIMLGVSFKGEDTDE